MTEQRTRTSGHTHQQGAYTFAAKGGNDGHQQYASRSPQSEVGRNGNPSAALPGLEAAAPAYRILHTNEVDAYEKKPTKTEVLEAPFLEAKKKRRAPGEQFGGTSRRAAKLSIADAKTE
jgi:hypothetical protein